MKFSYGQPFKTQQTNVAYFIAIADLIIIIFPPDRFQTWNLKT